MDMTSRDIRLTEMKDAITKLNDTVESLKQAFEESKAREAEKDQKIEDMKAVDAEKDKKIASLEEQTAYSTVRHLLVGNHDGTHVQRDQLLDILHTLVHRQLHAPENLWDHLLTYVIVVVERPTQHRVIAFSLWLADVMKKGRPTEPEDLFVKRRTLSAYIFCRSFAQRRMVNMK